MGSPGVSEKFTSVSAKQRGMHGDFVGPDLTNGTLFLASADRDAQLVGSRLFWPRAHI
jgi:hypothetical protein